MIRMKNIKYLLFALIGILAFTACSDDKENPIYNSATASAPTLTALSNAYTLAQTDADKAFATFTYTAANWGLKLATSYTLQTSLTEDFAKTYNLGTSTDISIPVATKDINSILINKGILPGTATKMYFRILANATGLSGNISNISTLTSAAVSTQVTPYDMDINYPKVYLIGDFNGWDHTKDLFLYSFESNTIYSGVIDFGSKASNGFKITGIAGWQDNLNWGSGSATITTPEASSIQLVAGGNSGNIQNFSNEFYNFTYDTSSLVLKKNFSFNTFSIIGDAVGGWNTTNDVIMNYDATKQRFSVDTSFSDGNMKFRADKDWVLNWGGSNGVLKVGGDNISVKAGKYRVIVDLNNPDKITYQLISLD